MRLLALTILIVGIVGASPATALDWSVYTSDPGQASPAIPFHQLAITTTDSVQIAAWFVPPQDSLGGPVSLRSPALLLVPREGETLPDHLPLIAALVHRGFAVLALEHRGHGASQPFPVDPRVLVYPEYRVDASSALDILWRRAEVDTTRIAVMGASQGAVVAMALAGRRPEIRAVVAVGLPRDWKSYYASLKKMQSGKEFFLPKTWEKRDDPNRVINRFNGAIFFVTGQMDLQTPAWMARELHRQYPRPKELWIVDDAGHGPERSPEQIQGDIYYDRVAGFLHRELDRPPHRGWPAR